MAPTVNRRRFLELSALATASIALAGCNNSPDSGNGQSGGGGGGEGSLTWWDFRLPIIDLAEEMHAKWAASDGGMPVELTYTQTSEMGQSLQLAKQSDQLPDVFTPSGLDDLSVPALIKDGWHQPLTWDQAFIDETFPPGSIVEGMHIFDGELYSFPIFSAHQYWAPSWFNTELLEQAGVDPAAPPTTFDEFRTACKAVRDTAGGDTYGWIFNLGMPNRVREQVNFLVQPAGFEGFDGRHFRTGEFRFHDDAYVNVIEFLLSLAQDGHMHPASSSLNDNDARTRWAAGAAAFYFDGPWCAGVVQQNLEPFLEKMGVGPMLVPEAGMPVTTYKPPESGVYWISGSCDQPEAASELLKLFASEDYYKGLARNMVQPPLDTSVLDSVETADAYKKCLELFDGTTFIAPEPVVKSAGISAVQQELKPVSPGIGEVIQGIFSGDLTDIRGALRDLSDRHEKAREDAIAAAGKKGTQVSIDDYAFPDWQPGQDYVADV